MPTPYYGQSQQPAPVPVYLQQQHQPHIYHSNGQPVQQQPAIQLSDCHGARKALLVGINYFNTRQQLKGCINDVQNMHKFLTSIGFLRPNTFSPSQNLVILTDDQQQPAFRPTKENMVNALKWLVGGAKPGDSLFFHFSGHGGQVKDRDGDEADGFDSCLYPINHERDGPLLDDDLHALCVKYLPPGVRMTVVLDCCHSGTGMDLPYLYNSDGSLKKYSPVKQIGNNLKQAGMSILSGRGSIGAAIGLVSSTLQTLSGNHERAEQISQQTRTSQADVILFSGCKDYQTSADTNIQGVGATGAMSYALIQVLSRAGWTCQRPNMTYLQILNSVRGVLRERYSQKPQLSSGRPMNMNQVFIM